MMMGNDNFFKFCRNEPGNWSSCNDELNNKCQEYARKGPITTKTSTVSAVKISTDSPSRTSSATALVPMEETTGEMNETNATDSEDDAPALLMSHSSPALMALIATMTHYA